jgi:hypothetical protein
MTIYKFSRNNAYGQNVKPYRGALLYIYEVGTTTPKTTYSDADETTAQTHPVVAGADGRFPAVYFSGTYKEVITDLDGVEQWSQDNLTAGGSGLNWIGDFDSSTNSSNYPSAGDQGDVYKVTTGFTLAAASGGHILKTGDFIIANKSPATAIDADWDIIRGVVQNTGTFALTDAATIATDCSVATVFTVTLGATRILGNPTNKNIGQQYTWIITGATYDLTYGSDFDFIGDSRINANGVTVIEGTVVSSSSIRCKIVNSPVKKIDFSTKNLKVDVASNTTVTVTADKIEFINSDGNTIVEENVSETFDITSDIHAGTEKASHWYDLDLSINTPGGTLIKKMMAQLDSTADADVSNSLSDSTATFQTDGVAVGDKIYQTTDNTVGYVKAVSSETVLTCKDADGADLDLFPDGNETYVIKSLSPTGAGEFKASFANVYNNSSSDLATSSQIDKEVIFPITTISTTVCTTSYVVRDCSAVIPITARKIKATLSAADSAAIDEVTINMASLSDGSGEERLRFRLQQSGYGNGEFSANIVISEKQKIYVKCGISTPTASTLECSGYTL